VLFKPYSDHPVRGSLQIVGDVLVVCWVVGWVLVGRFVHDAFVETAKFGYGIQGGAGGVADNLRKAGSEASGVPLVGDRLSTPFERAGGAAGSLAHSGQEFGDRLTGLALPMAVLLAGLPILFVILLWAPARWRYARRAGATVELARSAEGRNVLALRALAGQPTARLTAISADPVGDWRRGDTEVIGRLATMEMQRSGVRRRKLVARR
jgi:hypothetical protein